MNIENDEGEIAMKVIIEKLRNAQEYIKDIKSLKSEIDEMPQKYNDIKIKIEKSDKSIELNKLEIDKIDNEINVVKQQIEAKNSEIDRLDTTDDTDYKVINEKDEIKRDIIIQIDNSKRKLDDFEERKHKILKSIKSEESVLENLKQDLINEDSYIKDNLDKKISSMKKLEKKKNEIITEIKPDIIEKFERIIMNKELKAIVPLYKNYCSGCNMILPFSLINRVRKQKEIVFCPYCSRMLYYEGEEEAS